MGALAQRVCTQTANDTTPSLGGAVAGGCNILLTSTSNTGATAITDLDDVLSGSDTFGTYEQIVYIVGQPSASNPTTIADAGNFELERAWTAPGSGAEVNVLVLKTTNGSTFKEVTRHNGIRYFNAQVEINAGDIDSDFPLAQLVSGQSDTGNTGADRYGVVGEAAADGSNEAAGGVFIGETSSAENGTGSISYATVAATGDTTTAYGSQCLSMATHAGGNNVGLYLDASGSGTANYAIVINAGDISSTAYAADWDLKDNDSGALSYDATGAAGILALSSADGEETVAIAAKGTVTCSTDAATGDEYCLDIAWETDKSSSGDSYGLRIVHTATAVPASAYLVHASGVGSLALDVAGDLTLDSGTTSDHTTTFAYNSVARGELVATSTNFEIKGDGAIPVILHTETLSSAADTATVGVYSGNATNSGDHDSGAVSVYSGTSATAGDSGAVSVYSGNAADTSGAASLYSGTSANASEVTGDVRVYSGNQSSATGGSSGSASINTGTAAGTAATGVLNLYTGNQTNVGDYDSGQIDIYSGTSATLGDTGAVAIRSGAAADTSGAVD
jgi:hypothetical protein